MKSGEEAFEKLEAWRRSHALNIELNRLLAERCGWGCKDQITRSSNSFAQGAERSRKREFKQFQRHAKGSSGETHSQTLRAVALGYITQERGSVPVAELRELSA